MSAKSEIYPLSAEEATLLRQILDIIVPDDIALNPLDVVVFLSKTGSLKKRAIDALIDVAMSDPFMGLKLKYIYVLLDNFYKPRKAKRTQEEV
ncbi:MAG: hypothetical protein QW290_09345 [Sulfolobales archaeon]